MSLRINEPQKVTQETLPNIFDFLNYREYLRAFYCYKVSLKRGFSFAVFSRICAMNSSNYMLLVVQGDRNLTAERTESVAAACGLKGIEAEFFRVLVAWNQAKSPAQSEALRVQLQKILPVKSFKKIQEKQLSIINRWYALFLLEMVNLKDFKYDPDWIHQRTGKCLSIQDIKGTFENLIELGLLERVGDSLRKTSDTFLFDTPTSSSTIANYHSKNIPLAIPALKKVGTEHRHFIGVTAAIPVEALPEIKSMVEDFRSQVMRYLQSLPQGDEVFQLNLQLFPATWNQSKDKT